MIWKYLEQKIWIGFNIELAELVYAFRNDL